MTLACGIGPNPGGGTANRAGGHKTPYGIGRAPSGHSEPGERAQDPPLRNRPEPRRATANRAGGHKTLPYGIGRNPVGPQRTGREGTRPSPTESAGTPAGHSEPGGRAQDPPLRNRPKPRRATANRAGGHKTLPYGIGRNPVGPRRTGREGTRPTESAETPAGHREPDGRAQDPRLRNRPEPRRGHP